MNPEKNDNVIEFENDENENCVEDDTPKHISPVKNYYYDIFYHNTPAIRTILIHEGKKRTEYMFNAKENPEAESITSIDTNVWLRGLMTPYCEIIKGYRCTNLSRKEIKEIETPIDVHTNRETDNEIMFRVFGETKEERQTARDKVISYIKAETGQVPTKEPKASHKFSGKNCRW